MHWITMRLSLITSPHCTAPDCWSRLVLIIAGAISWYRMAKYDSLPHPLAAHQRFEFRTGSLVIRNVRSIDANKYICVASNSIGEAKCETELITFAPLAVDVEPKKLVAELKQRTVLNCSVRGHPLHKVIWLHNGQTVAPDHHSYEMQFFSDQSILVINAVANSDQGLYDSYPNLLLTNKLLLWVWRPTEAGLIAIGLTGP